MHICSTRSSNDACWLICSSQFQQKKSSCFVQYHTSNSGDPQKFKGQGTECMSMTVERVVGVYLVCSQLKGLGEHRISSPRCSGVKPQLLSIFGRFIRNIVRLHVFWSYSCPSTAKIISQEIIATIVTNEAIAPLQRITNNVYAENCG